MNKATLTSLFLLLTMFSQAAGNLSALFSYCSFDVPGSSPYIETYLHIIGNTVKFVPSENNTTKGQIEVHWTIKNGDSIVHFDSYNLNSPLHSSADTIYPDFIDQQRVKLAAGDYDIELTIKDRNSDTKPVSIKQEISVGFPLDSVSISDIELIESFTKTTVQNKSTKSGYDIVPSVNAFYPKQNTSLKFYAEVYRTNIVPADDYLVRYYISRYDNNQILPMYAFNMRQKAAPTNVVLSEIPIDNLQSGNYNLSIEVRNKKNELISIKQIMFQRSNPQTKNQLTNDVSLTEVKNTFVWGINDLDSLTYLIDCLHPIASNTEIDASDQLMHLKDITLMQKFLFYFWQNRDPQNPEGAWLTYMREVDKVNQSYSAMGRKGYATDRGRVYLQYGPPNTVSNETQDPSAYPYEIWHYYEVKGQRNRKFVFYAQELSTNEYKLLHSDAIGELQQPQWQAMLHDRIPTHKTKSGAIGIDQTESDDYYGSHSKDKFNNPR